MTRLHVGDSMAEFGPLRDDWDRLALAAGRIFATWEWAALWWHEYGGGRELALVPVHEDGGTLVAIVPLFTEARWPLRIARFVGHEGGDELGPICDPRDLPAVGRLLPGITARRLRCDLLLAESMPAVEWQGRPPGRPIHRVSSPAIDLKAGSWEGYLATLSPKLRHELVRGERKLRREHVVSYRVTEDPESLDADLDTLFKLHLARFPTDSSLVRREAFYRRFARVALDRGWLRLAVLSLDGRPAAARFDFRFGDVHFAYNAGRDPSWNRVSPGLILRAISLRDAIDTGAREYRFLLGGESYKYRWATFDREAVTVVVPTTTLGRTASVVAASLGAHRLGRSFLGRAFGG